MLAKQGNMCAICCTPKTASIKRFAVDHCHSSGRVRGILCARCNSILGHSRDNIETLKAAIRYLEIK
jgi:hypothetical protein